MQEDSALGRSLLEQRGIIYLCDEVIVLDGVRFYGSPWQPEFFNWAFNLPRKGPALRAKWDAIPDDTNVLVTHGPEYGMLDAPGPGNHVGCELLRHRLSTLRNLKAHIFGHIHEGYGARCGPHSYDSINASTCNRQYRPVNEPIVWDLKT
jgi:Icc-related predicted phosphoesterase